jgi:hypothetical protein
VTSGEAHHLLGQLARADTFRAFTVRTEDGREYAVEMAGRIAVPSSPQAATCVISVGTELYIVALDAITSIEVGRC